jgi:hypothetical protein
MFFSLEQEGVVYSRSEGDKTKAGRDWFPQKPLNSAKCIFPQQLEVTWRKKCDFFSRLYYIRTQRS